MENTSDLIKEEQTNFEENKKIEAKPKINSKYILVDILSFIDNNKLKLNLVMYNKELQKKLGVNIENYKKASGKIKKAEKNGKGKEYTLKEGIMIFDGEYLNGKRNGKGKEYYENRQLKFDGEYSNGKRNGKGKEYSDRGELIFEGEYLNDIRI